MPSTFKVASNAHSINTLTELRNAPDFVPYEDDDTGQKVELEELLKKVSYIIVNCTIYKYFFLLQSWK